MTYKSKIFAVAAVLMASVTVASAHTVSYRGTPTDFNQGVERDIHGAPHGSINNPSPHGIVRQQAIGGGYDGFARADNSSELNGPYFTGGGSVGYETLLKTY